MIVHKRKTTQDSVSAEGSGERAALTEMSELAFSRHLLDFTLASYKMEEGRSDSESIEQDYKAAKAQLPKILNDQQQEMLADLERLYEREAMLSLRVSFLRGLYAGFQHYFDRQNACTFEGLVLSQILTAPEMRRFPDYAEVREQANLLATKLGSSLDPFSREHLTSVECAWDERCFGVLRHGYHLGYHAAQTIIMDIDPTKQSRLIERGWQTAKELGLPFTLPE